VIVIEIDGVRVEAETEKEVRKEMRRLLKAQAVEDADRAARLDVAQQRAEANGYRVLARRAEPDNTFPRGWRLYRPQDEWGKCLFRPADDRDWTTVVTTRHGEARVQHWLRPFLGAVCDGGGYAWLVFLGGHEGEPTVCYAIATEGDVYALAPCPGITMDDFAPATEPAVTTDVAPAA